MRIKRLYQQKKRRRRLLIHLIGFFWQHVTKRLGLLTKKKIHEKKIKKKTNIRLLNGFKILCLLEGEYKTFFLAAKNMKLWSGEKIHNKWCVVLEAKAYFGLDMDLKIADVIERISLSSFHFNNAAKSWTNPTEISLDS